MLKKEQVAESNGKLSHLFIPGKTAALVSEFAMEDLPSAELQPRFLCLQWRTCLWAEHFDDDDHDDAWRCSSYHFNNLCHLKHLFWLLKSMHALKPLQFQILTPFFSVVIFLHFYPYSEPIFFHRFWDICNKFFPRLLQCTLYVRWHGLLSRILKGLLKNNL